MPPRNRSMRPRDKGLSSDPSLCALKARRCDVNGRNRRKNGQAGEGDGRVADANGTGKRASYTKSRENRTLDHGGEERISGISTWRFRSGQEVRINASPQEVQSAL